MLSCRADVIAGRFYKDTKTGKIVEVLNINAGIWGKVKLRHVKSGRITLQQDHYFMYQYELVPDTIDRRGMRNRGLHQYRFRDNPMEEKFARAWNDQNIAKPGTSDGRGTLDYLLAKDCNFPAGEVTARDRIVAATVIQWLGSPVGQGFLRDVQI